MKALKKITAPPWPALIAGVPAMVCMLVLRLTGMDEQGLFDRGSFFIVLIWLLTAAVVAVLVPGLRRMGGKAKYSRMFPVSTPGAAGILGAAAAMLWCAWGLMTASVSVLETLTGVLAVVSGAALVYLAWCRFRGIRDSFLLWSIVAVCLMLRLMVSYRVWSAQPELLQYFFPLMASVCLTLALYYRTAFCVGMGKRRMYLLFTQLGAFGCLVTLGAGFDLFYAGMLLWALLDLCSLRPMKTGSRERLPEEQP